MDDLNNRASKKGKPKAKVISSRLKPSTLHSTKLRLDNTVLASSKKSLNFSTKNLSNNNSTEKTISFDGCSPKPRSRIVGSRYKSTLNLDGGRKDGNLNQTNLSRSGSKNSSTGSDGNSTKASLMDKTSNPGVGVFSSTMLGGDKSTLQEEFQLLELPDISRICPPTRVSKKPMSIIKKMQIVEELEDVPAIENVSQKDVDVSYLNYLTWAYLDVSAQKQHQSYIQEAKNQLSFLSSTVNETKELVEEERKILRYLDWYEKVCVFYEDMKRKLEPIVESACIWESSLRNLGDNLEKQLCQIKVGHIYIPDDQDTYRDNLNTALAEMCSLLEVLNLKLSPRNEYLGDAKHQLSDILDQINITKRYTSQVERTAGATIDEVSLQLTINSMELQAKPSSLLI